MDPMVRIRQLTGETDVVVVGAGPGGATAAARLARMGLRVVLIDQHAFPRDKVCGDFLSPVALEELADLGLPSFPGYLATNVARSAAVFLEGKRLLARPLPSVPPLPDYGRVIPRLRLDAWILEAALKAGVRFIDGARVQGFTVESDGIRIAYQRDRHAESIHAPIAIAADGSSSVMARVLRGGEPDGHSRIVALRAYYEGVEGPADQADLYFSSDSFPGYYWLFPTGNGEANVGLGVATDTIPRSELRLRELLAEMVRKDAALTRRLRGAQLRGKVVGWPLATYAPSTPTVADRLLMVGDAANLINPLNGEGIQTALLSARWAAETVAAATASGDFSRAGLDGYRQRVDDELRYDMALASLIVQCIRNRTLNAVWMRLFRVIAARARRDAAYSHIAGGILAGVVNAGDALSWRMLSGTVQQTIWDTSVGAVKTMFRGPQGLAQAGLDSARLGFELAYDVAHDPAGFARWAALSGAGVIELARGAGAHARLPRAEP
jgi:geranylgeranyl reductase family protein